MNLSRLCFRELRHRKLNLLALMLGAAAAVCSLVICLALLERHDREIDPALSDRQKGLVKTMNDLSAEMRKATLKLSFNLVILPEGQNLRDWYDKDYASKCMPESYVKKLAASGIVTVRHFLPSLQQRVEWTEKKRTIILVGTRGEVSNLFMNPKRPLVQPVPAGTIVLGYELHRSLGIEEGDTVALLGRSFKVHKCYDERGNKDDITAWIPLDEAQKLLHKEGLINAILALECMCAASGALPTLRSEIGKILPGTQVIERGSQTLARYEARAEAARQGREAADSQQQTRAQLSAEKASFATAVVTTVVIAGALWIAIVVWSNTRARRHEIGILRAIGLRTYQILVLLLARSVFAGAAGGACGYAAGVALAGTPRDAARVFLLSIAAAVVLALVASWIPCLLAASRDPAVTLGTD